MSATRNESPHLSAKLGASILILLSSNWVTERQTEAFGPGYGQRMDRGPIGGSLVTTRTIEQTVTFRANPHDDSEALTDSEQHSQFTEAQANISREVGSSLTAYPMKDGYQAITRRKLFYWKIFPVGHARSLSRREFRNRVTTRLIKDGKSTIGPR